MPWKVMRKRGPFTSQIRIPSSGSPGRCIVVGVVLFVASVQSKAQPPGVGDNNAVRGKVERLTTAPSGENDLLMLPIVTNFQERHVLEMVSRFDISSTNLKHVHGPAEAKEG
jgi:hypothetical protein